MISTTVVSLTKIAQMLTSRIGRKPLLLALAATLACLQTAMAATPSYGRSAKATLAERTCSNGLNSLRRRLPGSNDGNVEDGQPVLEDLVQERIAKIKDELAVQQGIIDEQKRIIDKNAWSEAIAMSDSRAEEKRRQKISAATATMDQATTTMAELEAEKKLREKQVEQQNEKLHERMRREWWTEASGLKKVGVATGLATGMGAGIATAITLTKAGFKDLKDPTDENGLADAPHMGGAMLGLFVFLACYVFAMYLIFGNNGQFKILATLSSVGSALAVGGMISMMSTTSSEMARYGQSLVFGQTEGGIQAVTWCFSIGMIFMALAFVATVGFLIKNKWCNGPQ